MQDSPSELLVETRGPVLWLTLQREARRNALTHGLLAALDQAIDAVSYTHLTLPTICSV